MPQERFDGHLFVTPVLKQWPLYRDKEKNGGRYEEVVLGEQYVDMISGWWRTVYGHPVGDYPDMPLITRDKGVPERSENGYFKLPEGGNTGACCDNDVHEHFKCLKEIALTKAYMYVKKWEAGMLELRGRV